MGALRLMLVWLGLVLSGAAIAGTVSLSTEDGKTLSATSYGSGTKGVLLVHGKGGSAADWENFAGKLAQNGFRVLAIDLRGHGRSKSAADPLDEADWLAMVADVDAGAAWLKRQGAEVSVVGARLGANLALNAAQDNADITGVVLLSPGLNIEGLKVLSAAATYTGPVLVVASKGDTTSAKAATFLESKAGGPATLQLVDADGAGHKLINTEASLEASLVGWLNGARGEGGDLAKPDRTLETGTVDGIETTGTRYEDSL